MVELIYDARTGDSQAVEMVGNNHAEVVLQGLLDSGVDVVIQDLDCVDGVWVLNEIRQTQRLADEIVESEYKVNKSSLAKISEDIVQALAGVEVEDLRGKMNEFCRVLNKAREYEGKPPKEFVLNIAT